MTDITKCLGTGCSDKERCKRFTAPSSNYQSWAEFHKNHENCQHYIGIKGDWDEKRIDVIGQNGNIGYD
jgi:hypothetical protein